MSKPISGAEPATTWQIEFTDTFEKWWNSLSESEHIAVDAHIRLLEEKGPTLDYPYSSAVAGSKVGHLRELRLQWRGKPYRILYAFDPRRAAILLLGGNKSGHKRWYATHIPLAEALYEAHLQQLSTTAPPGQTEQTTSIHQSRHTQE